MTPFISYCLADAIVRPSVLDALRDVNACRAKMNWLRGEHRIIDLLGG